MKESDLLAHIAQRSAGLSARFPHVAVGPGDDCAVVRTPTGDNLLLTTDQLVEGRHYASGTPIDLIARKAVARSVSDIAAMGGTPTWALATACLPRGYAHADALFVAMKTWAEHWNCPLVGGDIASFGQADAPLVLTVTVGGMMGARPGAAVPSARLEPVGRAGAIPGDVLFVTGALGGSLASGRHLTFEPRLAEGASAAALGAHAMIDISDGLGRDAARIARASRVALEIDARTLPPARPALTWQHAVRDGEDYELLIAGPRSLGKDLPALITIGHVRALAPGEAPTALITDPAGVRHDVANWGWDHH